MEYYETEMLTQYRKDLDDALDQLQEEQKILYEATTDRQLKKIEKRIIKLDIKVKKARAKVHEEIHNEKQLTIEQLRALNVLMHHLVTVLGFIIRLPFRIFWIFRPKEKNE